MLKKSLLSLAITASVAGLSGCNISSVTGNDQAIPESQVVHDAGRDGKVTHNFDALNSVFALGTDLIFADAATTDGTANVGDDGGNPVLNALNSLDGGISTLAPIDLNLTGTIDPTSINVTNARLIRLPNQADAATMVLPFIELDEDGSFVGAYNAAVALDDGHTSRQMTAFDLDALSLATIGALFSSLKVDGAAPAAATETVFFQNLNALVAMQPTFDDDYKVEVIDQDGGTNNTVRFIPQTPLDGKTKYITVLTAGITDADGEAIMGAETYDQVTGTGDLFSPALAPVRALYQNLEAMVTNIATVAGTQPTLLPDDIVSTTARTTGDPTMLLKAMAYPGYWAKDAVAGGSAAVAKGLSDQLTAAAYENPRERPFELIEGVTVNANLVSVPQVPFIALNAASIAVGGDKVLLSQGAIQLPQYLTSLVEDGNSTWEANTVISGALGIATPTDKGGEDTNVTYRYPFAEVQRTIVAPLLFIQPAEGDDVTAHAASNVVDSNCDKPVAGWPVIIFQHGITTNRATSLLAGTALAVNTCSVVVAMDLTHHGVAPQDGNSDGELEDSTLVGFTVDYNAHTATYAPWATAANTQSATDGSILATLAERHEGLYTVGGVTTPMSYEVDNKAGDSGDFFIRLDNFQRSRDNQGQSVMDLLNLNATLSAIDIDGVVGADLDTSDGNVRFVGHSLGALVGTVFAAVNNDTTVQDGNTTLPLISELIMATPAGGTPKFLETSVSFGGTIKAGLLAAAGISPGDSSFESFMQVMQATLDPIDPLNFIGDLAVGGSSPTSTLVFEMVGGAAITADSADHSGTAGMPTIFYNDATANTGVYPSDLTIPNNNDTGPFAEASAYFAAFTPDATAQVELTGTDAYLSGLGAAKVTVTTGNTQTATHLYSQLTSGVHGTFSSANGTAAFFEMMTQAAYFIGANGQQVIVGNDGVLNTEAVAE